MSTGLGLVISSFTDLLLATVDRLSDYWDVVIVAYSYSDIAYLQQSALRKSLYSMCMHFRTERKARIF